jgi:hypothetical protein
VVNPEIIGQYNGGAKEWIWNSLPSAPPTFLRAGFLLLTNYPENRSVRLTNIFHIFAVLKDA